MTSRHPASLLFLLTGFVSGQATWVQQSPANSPAPRGYGTMVYDALHLQILMFGGLNLDAGGTFFGDTWAWNGTNWTQLNPATNPAARATAGMVYDELHQQVVMFGGFSAAFTGSAETWVWDGANWTLKTPATSPSQRRYASMAYDTAHQQTVLFGGIGPSCLADTWVWDGTTWTQKHPATNPAPSYCNNVMTYDPVTQQVVLIVAELGLTPDQTWTWDGTDWTLRAPTTDLPQRYGMRQISYDSLAQKIIEFAGDNSFAGFISDTWTWDGATWAQLPTTVSPPPRADSIMAFDPIRQQTVIFGGLTGNQGPEVVLNDTWTLASTGGPGVTITVPAGVQYSFNNQTYTGTQTISVAPGSYTLSTTSPQQTAAGTQAIFASWSDAGAISHSVTVGSTTLPITGNFTIQYLLTTSANPSNGGTVTQVSAASFGPYYTAGTLVTVFQSPSAGFTFTGWSGACSGTGACFVSMNAPATVTGSFNRPTYSVNINVPTGIQYSLGGFPFTGSTSILLPAGSYFLSLPSPQATATGTQAAFISWSDGGAQSHTLVVTTASVTVTGTFKTQYLLTVNASPSADGSVSPGTGYYDAGSAITPIASPNTGFDFEYWSGACTGSNPFCLFFMTGPVTLTANFGSSLKWVPVFPSVSPSPRVNSQMAYDSTHAVMVMFGGYGSQGDMNDTWEWNGTTWNLRTPANSPPARHYGALAYDPIRHQTVLFGGLTAAGSRLADTWVWDGTTWTQKAGGPSARSSTRMVFDAPRNQILLFGGAVSDTTTIGDTWVWNGTSWTQLSPALSPSARAGQGMVYDEARQQVLLLGGVNEAGASATLLNDTWVWNGSWTKLSPVNAPEVRYEMAIAFDQVAQQVVMFAGLGGDFSNAVWFWDGSNWTKKTYVICPTDRAYPAAAYDIARQQLVLFAGEGAGLLSPSTYLNDTWIFSNNLNPPQYPLSISAAPPGEGTVAQYAPGQPGLAYYAGSPVLVTATPNMGYELQSWTGACAGAGICVATMSAPQSVTANFGPARTWTEVFPTVSPSTNNGEFGAMAYDKARNQMVLVDEQSHTWTFDGINWTLKNPATNLNSLLRQLVYDEANSQIVAAGGNGVFETWVWDGTNWTQKFPATQPSVRASFGLAYDAALGKVILFGGDFGTAFNDTWMWNGSAGTWTQTLPAHSPGGRTAASMAYDSLRQVVVLFGGLNLTSVTALNDTWVFNGADWVQESPATPPGVRNCSAMAWDEAHQQMVLFGGTSTTLGAATFLADTWIWDGMNWAPRTPVLSPPVRACSVMAYDASHQVPVLFGGFGAGLVPRNDTWIYGSNAASPTFTLTTVAAGSGTIAQSASGQPGPAYLSGTQVTATATAAAGYEFQYWSGACTGSSPTCTVTMSGNLTATANFGVPEKWVQLAPATSPLPTPGATAQNTSMAYDQARQQIVLFGGSYNGSQTSNETWIWDGATWTQKFPSTVPPVRYAAALAYDAIHQQVVMFGGATQTAILSDTWVWDGTNWTQKAAGLPGPAGRINHGMAFDGQQIVMFGGWDADFAGFVVYGDTWTWDGTSWTQRILATRPPQRSDFGMAYDAARNRVVVFSGFDAGTNDTWLWNGSTFTWTQAHPVSSPPAGWNVMSWDSVRQQMIAVTELYLTGGPLQTWSWDGANWTQKILAVNPPSRYAGAMAFDAARQQMILFSGANTVLLGDTWALLGPSVNLVAQAPVLSKNANGYDLVTVSLKNQGNIPLTSISLTSNKVGTLVGVPITTTSLTSLSPGATASFTVEVPTASLAGSTTSLSFQGIYSTATVTNSSWTISIRSVNLP